MRWLPRVPAPRDHYPYDFDGSERQVRLSPVHSVFGYPYFIGCLSGFLAQADTVVYRSMLRKVPSGPSLNLSYTNYPGNLQYQIIIPGLQKEPSQ